MVTVTGKSRLGRLFGKDGRGYEPQVVMQWCNCGKSLDVTVASPSLQNRQKIPMGLSPNRDNSIAGG